jgi:hypothetical protein
MIRNTLFLVILAVWPLLGTAQQPLAVVIKEAPPFVVKDAEGA